MAIKSILAYGVGFSPGSVKYLPVLGFLLSGEPAVGGPYCVEQVQAFSAGATITDRYIAGPSASDRYVAGPGESDAFAAGPAESDTFTAGDDASDTCG